MRAAFELPAEPRAAVVGADGLWTARDLLRALRGVGGGALGLAFAWWRASDEADWSDALPWITIAVASILLAGAGFVSWLLVGLQRVSRERQLVAEGLGRG